MDPFSTPQDLIGVDMVDLGDIVNYDEPPSRGENDPDSVQAYVATLAKEARDWHRENVEPDMAKATDYYYGRPFGDEVDGQSQVVSTDVRDVTMAQMPDLLRIFLGPEEIVRFMPVGAEDEPLAQEMTAGVQYSIRRHPKAFLEFQGWMKDALVRRLGWVTWWWEGDSYEEQTVIGSAEQMMALDQDPDYEILELQPLEGAQNTFQARVVYQAATGYASFAAVPPEEVFWAPGARGVDDSDVLVWARERPVSEVIAMGYSYEELEDFVGDAPHSESDDLKQARLVGSGPTKGADLPRELRGASSNGPKSRRPIYFAEVYAYVDDEEGMAELRLFHCVGEQFYVLNGEGEPVDEIPFAPLTPEPEPHTLMGLGNFDHQREVQRVKSQLQREMFNSLARAIDERMEIVTDEVNLADLLNPQMNKFIRVRRPGMMREIDHTFQGANILPVLAYYDTVREDRGVPRAAAGLDPDSLQSSTRAGVVATVQGAKAKVEMIARVFAETGYRRLFKGLARLMHKHGTATKIRLNGQVVPVNPSTWNLDFDVEVDMALGMTDKETQIAQMQGVIEALVQLRELGAPMVTNVEIYNAFDQLFRLLGHKNTTKFLRPWGEEQEQQLQAQMAEQQKQTMTPDQMLFMLEQAKLALEGRKLDIEEGKAFGEADLKRDEMAQKTALELLKLEVEGLKVQIEDFKAKAAAAASASSSTGDA